MNLKFDYLSLMKLNKEKIILFFIVILGAILRLKGIYWGIPTLDIPHTTFHPDESWAMGVLGEANVQELQFNMLDAHREGTLSYYILLLVYYLLYVFGFIHSMPNELAGFGGEYGLLLFSGRVIVVIFDLLSVYLVYLTVKNLTKDRISSLTSATIFAIMPFEVIHSHYLRTHIFVNFFVLMVIYQSTFLFKNRFSKSLFIKIGFLIGLATATKYNSVAIIAIPVLILYSITFDKEGYYLFQKPFRIVSIFFNKNVFYLFFALVLGFFLADPYLFLQFDTAKDALFFQASVTATEEFSFSNLLDLTRIWIYISHLIPYGNLPFLWAFIYSSILYLLFRRNLYKLTLPFIIFLFIYIYPMAKGYAGPIYIRASLMIFPVLAILAGIAWGDFIAMLKYQKIKLSAWIIFFLITFSSVVYDWAYVKAMSGTDPRIELYNFLKQQGGKVLKIGTLIDETRYDTFVIDPVINILESSGKVKYTRVAEYKEFIFDYFILYAFEYNNYPVTDKIIKEMVSSNKYILIKTFDNPLKIFNFKLQFDRVPHDLAYPMPTIYLLKAR